MSPSMFSRGKRLCHPGTAGEGRYVGGIQFFVKALADDRTCNTGALLWSYDPNVPRELAASNAFTRLHAVDTYMTPSMTSGVASWPRFVSRSTCQARPSCFTFLSEMRVSGLNRCSP